ncbi:uncharacterized protein [Clytia hemisphaerica]|uniref:uncharacterized protein isoform X1 n=1 Tax=Clytia hemisphaerica TaxID=252671 RepID=UPI0034D72956
MGKFAILLNLVICFVVFQKVSSKKVTICRGKEQSLVCQEGTGSLLINSAVLLRESRTECGDLSSWFIWCPKQAVSERVKEICNGNKHCTLMNDRSFLRSNQIEDECDSIDTRYLEIDYQCSGEPTIPPTTVPPEENNITMIPIAKKSQTICELDHGEIMCPGTTKINITSVFWGRRENEEICQSNYYTDKETSIKKCDFNNEEKKADLFQSMQKQCNNESKCQFFIPKWYLGNPCPESEVAKYLDINYDCMTDDGKVTTHSWSSTPVSTSSTHPFSRYTTTVTTQKRSSQTRTLTTRTTPTMTTTSTATSTTTPTTSTTKTIPTTTTTQTNPIPTTTTTTTTPTTTTTAPTTTSTTPTTTTTTTTTTPTTTTTTTTPTTTTTTPTTTTTSTTPTTTMTTTTPTTTTTTTTPTTTTTTPTTTTTSTTPITTRTTTTPTTTSTTPTMTTTTTTPTTITTTTTPTTTTTLTTPTTTMTTTTPTTTTTSTTPTTTRTTTTPTKTTTTTTPTTATTSPTTTSTTTTTLTTPTTTTTTTAPVSTTTTTTAKRTTNPPAITTQSPTRPPDFNQVCDQDTREITCYDNQVIQIGHAFYGHDPVKQNNCSVSQEKAQCGHDVTAQLNLICGGSRGCQVSALTDRFPATGCGVDVKPYVSFSYVCVNNTNKAAQPTKMTIPSPGPSAQVLTKNLSAGKGSFIGCFTEGTVIYVKSAWFGNKTLNCGKDVLKTVKYDCGGGTFCSLSADAGKYGRTDCSTSAELKLSMEYQCTPKPPGTIPPIPQPLVNTPTHSRNVPAVNINDAAQCGRQMRVRQRRVIQPAEAKAGRWPWQVEIYTSANNHICGGAMITNRWLLTAAHCIDKSNVATASEKYFVVLGEFNRSRNEGHEFKYNIQRVILHPGYDPQTLNAIQHDKDIALMQLDQNVELTSYIGTVCVPNTQNIDYWDNCVLTGWGKPTYPGSSAYVLQQGLLNVVTNQECQRKLKEDSVGEPGDEITSNMICGDDKTKSGVSGCQGDSGGPFVCRRKSDNKWYLRGLVSWGSQRCEIKEMYQVLTRVSSFYQWITNNI